MIHQLGVQAVASLESGCTQRFAVDPAAWNDTVCAASATTNSRYCPLPEDPSPPPGCLGASRESVSHPFFLPRPVMAKSGCNPQLAASGAVGRRSSRTATALAAEWQAARQSAAQCRIWHTAIGARGQQQPTQATRKPCASSALLTTDAEVPHPVFAAVAGMPRGLLPSAVHERGCSVDRKLS